MSEKRITAKAIIRVTVEIRADSLWGADTTIDQIHRQALDDVLGKIRNGQNVTAEMKLVSEPQVISIITEEKR
jgi:hypothetical protein